MNPSRVLDAFLKSPRRGCTYDSASKNLNPKKKEGADSSAPLRMVGRLFRQKLIRAPNSAWRGPYTLPEITPKVSGLVSDKDGFEGWKWFSTFVN